MTKREGEILRAAYERQKIMESPDGRLALESATRRKQRLVDKKALEVFEAGYVPELPEQFKEFKTEEQIELEEKLKNFM